jgi:membrane protease YdiL (CAAX protease family)
MSRAIIYLLGIIIAEIAAVVLPTINPDFVILGLVLYGMLLVAMIIDAARMDRYYQGKLVLSLALVPLIRIFSLVLPLAQVPQMWWYPLIYLPLLTAAIVVAYILEYKPSDIGVTWRGWPWQIPLAILGLGLGYIEYNILSPQPLITGLTLGNAWLLALLIFISTGVVEELIFRGVMQKSAFDLFGTRGIIYVSVIFVVLHLGWAVGPNASPLAWLDLLFVFGVALLFGWIVKKTGSLLGVILCHGIINVVLFVIMPLLFTA